MTASSGKPSRLTQVLKNAKVNSAFYLTGILLAFISRKVFLECLGDEYVGLTGTLTNILGYLNLAELGFGSALIFNLYKPLYNNDRNKINDLVSFYGYFNRRIGIFILLAGTLFSFFIPLIFTDADISTAVVFFAFYVILISSTLGYFLNYRQILLFADQRAYIFNAVTQSGTIVKTIVQIVVSIRTGNYYAWVAIELLFALILSVVLNRKIRHTYPWLSASVKTGKLLRQHFAPVMATTRKVFVHKVKDFLLMQNDQFIVFIFLSLKMVAFYGNYVMIISRLFTFITHLFAGTESGIGNLIAENNQERLRKVFWELTAVRYLIAGIVCYGLYNLITPFVSLWIGDEYILDNGIVALLVFNLFIMISRGTVDDFNSAYGHYDDTWAAWVELSLNIGITVLGGYFLGLYGILLGKTASLITIVIFWKPYYLYSKGLRLPYSLYWKGTLPYLLSCIAAVVCASYITDLIGVDPYESFVKWIAAGMCHTLLFAIAYFGLIVGFCPGGSNLLDRILKRSRTSYA